MDRVIRALLLLATGACSGSTRDAIDIAPADAPSCSTAGWEHVSFTASPHQDGTLIDTSREVNGTPGIQLDDEEEFFGEADECITLTVVIGSLGAQTSALAVDADDDVFWTLDDVRSWTLRLTATG
jgi:hypothetical protein